MTGVIMMTIKVVSHQVALQMQQNNRQLEQSLLLTPMPSMFDDLVRQQVFSSPYLQLTNWAFELGVERAEQLKKAKEAKQRAIRQQQRLAQLQRQKQDDELEL